MNSPFAKSLTISMLGTGISVMELLQGASLFLVVVGGILSAGGGWYAFRLKRLEFLERERALERQQHHRRR